MIANTLIGVGILAVALGSWMHFHPKPRPKFTAKTEIVAPYGPDNTKPIDADRKIEIRLNSYFAKSVIPRTWMRLGIQAPVPSYHKAYYRREDGTEASGGWQNIDTAVTMTIGPKTIGPFPVDHWFYNEFKTYDRAVITSVIEAVKTFDGDINVSLDYYGGYGADWINNSLNKSFSIPSDPIRQALIDAPQPTTADRIQVFSQPLIQRHMDQFAERREVAQEKRRREKARRRWRNNHIWVLKEEQQ